MCKYVQCINVIERIWRFHALCCIIPAPQKYDLFKRTVVTKLLQLDMNYYFIIYIYIISNIFDSGLFLCVKEYL